MLLPKEHIHTIAKQQGSVFTQNQNPPIIFRNARNYTKTKEHADMTQLRVILKLI